ncbi:hypothetical protein CEXT_417341 [Caerostris extrusa]|uniref:Uncharacterized protein n=1 Tax=Caerostris extrusa TaxID=172846 RepID=A0AAV4Q6T6_CAEEX|nr:hypothetical protein CEXT_417341 [Caerostris extrusa]
MSALKDMPDLTQPEKYHDGPETKEMGVEICPTNYTCVSGNRRLPREGRRKVDCCPKTTANAPNNIFLGAGECCHQLGFIWHCCTPLAPKCKWWGCWFN